MGIRFEVKGAPCQSNNDPELFFPDPTDNAKIKEAKAVCKECSVITECITFAIRTRSEGIWGGMTTRERQKYRLRLEKANANKQKASRTN